MSRTDLAPGEPALTPAEFAARVEQALLNVYHGDTEDTQAAYVVREGRLPHGLTGRVFTTVFPYESVLEGPGTPAAPHVLTATGRVLTIDFGAGPEPLDIVPVATTAIQNES